MLTQLRFLSTQIHLGLWVRNGEKRPESVELKTLINLIPLCYNFHNLIRYAI